MTNAASKRQYILYPCGSTPPDVSAVAIPAGYQQKKLAVPVQKAVTAETVSYNFMQLLDNGVNDMGMTDRLLALSPYSTDSCAQKALACAPDANKCTSTFFITLARFACPI